MEIFVLHNIVVYKNSPYFEFFFTKVDTVGPPK